MCKKVYFIFSLILLFQFSAPAQQNEPAKDSRYYEILAVKAYQTKDFPSFLENMKLADNLQPNHPRITYNIAIAYNLNGKTNESITALNKLAAMKLYYSIEKSADLASLKDNSDFQTVLKKMDANKLPVGDVQTTLTVKEKGLVPESIVYDPAARNYYLSSVAQRKILRVNEGGESTVFADQNAGLWSALGMKIDSKRRILWVTTTAFDETPNLKSEEKGSAAILKFDLKTGKVIKKYVLPNNSKPHALGDLVIASNGDVYTTDSLTAAIYIIRQDKDEIELFLENENFTSPQGLDFTPDGKYLLMADYSRGIFKINLQTKQVIRLTPAPDLTLLGIDGLYFYKNSLIATQNGVNPQRVVRIFLSKDFEKAERFEVLAANNPVFDDITLGFVSGNQFYFIANSQWNSLGANGQFAKPENLQHAIISKINLTQ